MCASVDCQPRATDTGCVRNSCILSVIGLVVVRSKLCVVGLVAGGPKMAVVELVGGTSMLVVDELVYGGSMLVVGMTMLVVVVADMVAARSKLVVVVAGAGRGGSRCGSC